MKEPVEVDLEDLVLILEGFEKKKDRMSEADLIDLAARLKPAAKHIEKIDKYIKDQVKEKLNHKEGTRLGGLFKAVLTLIPVGRFDQKTFKEERPKIYENYIRDDTDERVTFEVR